jgi:hypothetical protein
MGEPTDEERGLTLATTLPSSDFLAWAKHRGHEIKRMTPASELSELLSEYRLERERAAAEQKRKKAMAAEDARSEAARDTGAERRQLRELIAKAWAFSDAAAEADAQRAVNRAIPIQNMLQAQYWQSDRQRWAYARYHLRFYYAVYDGRELSYDELLDAVVREEQVYLREIRQRDRPVQRAKLSQRLREQASAQPMNPADNFDPGIADYVWRAGAFSREWVDTGITGSEFDSLSGLELKYSDGNTLTIPLSKELIFADPLKPQEAVATFARRHRKSGRLVPFVVYRSQVGQINLDTLYENDVALLGLPRFDPAFTPAILSLFSPQQAWLQTAQGVAAVVKLLTLGKALPVTAETSENRPATSRVGPR